MKNGVMAEVGTHDQLLSLNKVYADMIFHQSLSEKGGAQNSKHIIVFGFRFGIEEKSTVLLEKIYLTL